MGNCIHKQIDEQEYFEQELSISQSHFSITSEVEKHMYFNHLEDFTNYGDFTKWVNHKWT